MYEPGWQRLDAEANREFTRDGLRQIASVCRIMAIKNPLIKRGLSLRQTYVWGQDVDISARDPEVNDLIQDLLDDPGTRRSFSGPTAREELERALGTDGNVFLALFTSPLTGRVQVRSIPFDEISDVITNPEDRSEPWYYRREWWSSRDTGTGQMDERHVAYYPAVGYRPASKPRRLVLQGYGDGIVNVQWDAPVVHIAVNRLQGWKFGIPDAYAAIDWAHAYKDFLSDWATLIKSLSRFAWKLTSKGSKQAAARARMAAQPTRDPLSGEANHAGASALLTPDMGLEAIPKSGATIDSDSGRPLAAMVAAALDVPVTMLLGDPGVTGARATAETLDTPTEHMASQRRAIWGEAFRAIFDYVVARAVDAPKGPLKGKVTADGGYEQTELASDAEATVDVAWPDVTQTPVGLLVDAIVKADQTTYLPPLVVARLLLQALGVSDVDEIISELTDDQGNYLRPDGAGGGAGQAAIDAFRRGEDPAAVLAQHDPAADQVPSDQQAEQPTR
jgi:hypothetical protein